MLKPSRFAVPAVLTAIAVVMVAEPAHAGSYLPPAAVPEPSSLVLFGVGAAAVGALGWWRKRK